MKKRFMQSRNSGGSCRRHGPRPDVRTRTRRRSQAPARHGDGLRGRMRQRMMQALNLTDAQKQQAKAIFQQARQNAQPLEQLQENRRR